MITNQRFAAFTVGHILFAGGIYAVAGFAGISMFEGVTLMLLGFQINWTTVNG